MEKKQRPGSTAFVIFGAAGDLAWRKLIPALYNLYLDSWMPSQFLVLGVDRSDISDDKFRDHLRDGVDQGVGYLCGECVLCQGGFDSG